MLESLNTLIAFALIMTVVSLLITIVVQMISTALNLRGRNLAKALRQILQTTAPGTSQEVKKAAEQITGYLLTRPHLSDHAFFNIFRRPGGTPESEFAKPGYKLPWLRLNRFATAVRSQEVFDTLLQLAQPRGNETGTLAQAARTLLKQMGVSIDGANAVRGTIEDLKQAMEALKSIPGTEKLIAAIEEGKKRVAGAIHAPQAAWERFNFWFEATQDRAQQWFAMHTRFWTIIFAIVFAFVCELDTVEIYQKVSTDRVLREKLVSTAAGITSQAEKALADAPIIQEALNVWRKQNTNAPFLALITNLVPEAAETRGAFLTRLQMALGAQPTTPQLIADFGKVLEETVQSRLAQQNAQFAQLKAGLESSGFPLIVPGGRWAGEKGEGRPWTRHFWGMLMTAGFLTLGAPFWFNALKSLTNLRSLVARDISKEEQTKNEAAAKHSAPLPPPPTAHLPTRSPGTQS